jgi:hypothetical protein
MQELDSPVIVIVREHNHMSPHVVHDHHEPLEHGIYRLTSEMREILVLSSVGHKETSLNLSVPDMSIIQLLLDPACQVFCLNPIEFGLTQSTVQVSTALLLASNMSLDPGARKFTG